MANPKIKLRTLTPYELALEALEIIQNNDPAWFFGMECRERLLNEFRRNSFELSASSLTFDYLSGFLVHEVSSREFDDDKATIARINDALSDLESFAVYQYFAPELQAMWKDEPIHSIARSCRANLRRLGTSSRYLTRTLSEILRETDARIEEAKQERADAVAIGAFVGNGNVNPEQIRSKKGKIRDEHPDLTIDRAVFLLERLLPDFDRMDQAALGRLLSFLTSFDAEGLRQSINRSHNKDSARESAFRKDMGIVRKYLVDLGLMEKVEQLDRDLAETDS